MIVRQPIECTICGQPHTTRVGLGHGSKQEHKFPCRQCDQEIGFAVLLDQDKSSWAFDQWDNCSPIEEVVGAPIVNLEADFLVPADLQGVDRVFPRLMQFEELFKAREAAGLSNAAFTAGANTSARPNRRSDYADEWLDLRRSWLLNRSGKAVLVRAAIKKGGEKYYGRQAPQELSDWVFRFCLYVGGIPVEKLLNDAVSVLKPLQNTGGYEALMAHYDEEMSSKRGRLYLEVMNGFFGAYTDFSQILQRVSAGLDVPPDLAVSSAQFDRTRMFYGNAFEALGSLADFLAYANNVAQGRDWDRFQSLTVKKYLALDKSARFGPFETNPPFAAFAQEADNQLRNASHHGGMEMDRVTHVITYRSGKGGQGDPKTLTYTEYLARSLNLFNQVLALLALELLITQARRSTPL